MPSLLSAQVDLSPEGADVKELQSNLITLGYDCGKWGADSDFGDHTELAVEKFQKAQSLVIDGIVGVKTVAALVKAITDIKPGIVYNGDLLDFSGEIYENGWLRVAYKNQDAWVSGKYGKLVG